DARHEIVVRHEPDDLMLRISTARKRGGGPGDGGQLDEIAAVHAPCNPLPSRSGGSGGSSRSQVANPPDLPDAHDPRARSVVACQAVVRRFPLPMTVHAET